MTKAFLYGMHDPGGEHLLPAGSWKTFTEGIGCDPNNMSGGDYRQWSDKGYNVLVRLNNGYGADGTIPASDRYADFAARCANYVRNSPGCHRWIIGNEPNHEQEWPQGQMITAAGYAACFRAVASAIYEKAGGQHKVIAAAVAPWTDKAGDWLVYQAQMLTALQGFADGIAVHTYTHGTHPDLVHSTATMNPPYQDRFYHFYAYRQLLEAIPSPLRGVPVYITETDQDDAWANENSGWVQDVYSEIDWWNHQAGKQKIMCVCLYRWPNIPGDRWGIADKPGVHADLQAAVAKGYVSPNEVFELGSEVATPQPTPTPPATPAPPSAPTLPAGWDPRLTQRGVTFNPADHAKPYWKLVKAEFRNVEQSGGRHHVYVDVLDEAGRRVVGETVDVGWQDGSATLLTEAKPGEEAAANYPMYASGNSYTVSLGAESDAVEGMGLGDIATPHQGDHVSYYLVFQRSAADAVQPKPPSQGSTVHLPVISGPPQAPATPAPPPKPVETPVVIQQPTVTGILDPLVLEAVLDIESGGSGLRDGKVVIRFEPAVFEKYVPTDVFAKHFRYGNPAWTNREFNPGGGWRSMEGGGQGVQWEAYELAKSLNAEAAAKSISMGAGQIMGFNHASVGYSSAQAMLKAFQEETTQLIATINFVLARPELAKAVNNKDWRTIARIYNGTGQVDHYAKLLGDRYIALKARA